MSTIIHDQCEAVVTRKPHRCPGCRLLWPKGTRMSRVVFTDMGKIASCYWCEACDAIVLSHNYHSDDLETCDGELRDDNLAEWEAECKKAYGFVHGQEADGHEGTRTAHEGRPQPEPEE